MNLEEDATFSHYTILSKIGEGGMGEVYQANDTKLDRKVALKVLSSQLTENTERLQRFKQEARAVSALNHPHILTIYEFGESEKGTHFIATEFVDGETLNRHSANKNLSLSSVLDIAMQVASALSAAHESGRKIKLALKSDPLSQVINRVYGITLLYSRRYDEAGVQERKTIELDGDVPGAYEDLSEIYALKRDSLPLSNRRLAMKNC